MRNYPFSHIAVRHRHARRKQVITALFLFLCLLMSSPADAATVLIVGDTQYAMVADAAQEIQAALRSQSREYATADIKGRLWTIVEREDARIVVALGSEAVSEALRLPPSVTVVYGLVAIPPKGGRGNMTGVYMSPPVNEYVTTVRRYLPELSRISVIGSQNMIKNLFSGGQAQVAAFYAGTPSELVSTVNRQVDARALLLLPDANLLTSQVMANVFLFSFRNNIPLLGISEAHVKQGSLFALVFDPKTVSRQIGEKVQALVNGTDIEDLPASPPRKYNLFINANTAQKMGIELPEEMLKKAKKVY